MCPDITMCSWDDCPFKYKCYRFKAPVNPYRQSYFDVIPLTRETIDQPTRQEVDIKCQYFIKDN